MLYDVVIVGAGPIGLATAWGIKAINPNLKVLIIEKYPEYQRKHNLIMQAHQLKELMTVTRTTQNPTLSELYQGLLKDPHIRTSALEHAFKSIAIELGVDFQYTAINAKNISYELMDQHPAARLIIGADGTHSQVSQKFFSKENQIKHDFDYVLQLRFETKGDSHQTISALSFFSIMVKNGLIANEYMGHFDPSTSSTPVTMQAMITKEEFRKLKLATSKDPIQLYSSEKNKPQLPDNLLNFINDYLQHKSDQGLEIDEVSVKVSVNEAPAIRANKIYTKYKNRMIVLAGDAGLGLSYFKGLNAGLESTKELLFELTPWLQNKTDSTQGFKNYQTWFDVFANKKINEVRNYSLKNIHFPWKIIQASHSSLQASNASFVKTGQFIESSSWSLSHTMSSIIDKAHSFFKIPASPSVSEEKNEKSSLMSKIRKF